MTWLGSPGNRVRAVVEDLRISVCAVVYDEPQGKVYQCPRCGCPLLQVDEHAFAYLLECPQCEYAKRIKQ